MRLSNGAEIVKIEVRPGRPGEMPHVGKVLAREHNQLHPYVVWSVASEDGDTFDAFRGDYCRTLEEAEEGYTRRRV